MRECGWPGCSKEVLEINSRTSKPYYYCGEHKQARKKHKQTWYENNREYVNAAASKRWHDLREKFLIMYGNECVCCGEKEEAFLSLDHVNNDGSKHRKDVGNYGVYYDAIKIYDTSRFQILCYNCNFAKQTRGKCPHSIVGAIKS